MLGFKVAVGLLAALLCSAGVEAQVKGVIIGPGAQSFPIAISALKDLGMGSTPGKQGHGIADAIAYDLELSGWFRVLDRSAYIEEPQATGIEAGTFDFRDWSVIGAEALVKGGFQVKGEDLMVELRLFDVFQQRMIVGKRYTGKTKDFRRIAHKFADEIVFQFTGVRGVFDTRLAYVSNSGGRFKEVYVAHLDGSEKVQVTSNRTINLLPSWSADGRSLLYTSYKDGRPGLYRYDLATGRESRFSVGNGSLLGGKWSPDGRFVAATLERAGNTGLILLDSGGRFIRELTQGTSINVSPTWSPDGAEVAFVSDRSGSPQIYAVETVSGKTRRVTYGGGYHTSPAWSPKGDRIAYVARTGRRFSIFTTPAQGGEAQQLTADSGDSEDPSWSADGRHIVFSSNRRGRYHLYVMQETGDQQKRLTGSGGDDINPSWSPRLN
jgi:TolB protein